MLFDYIDNLTSDLILRWRDNVRGGLPTAVFGVTESARYYHPFLTGESFLYIAKDALSAKKTRDEMSALTGKDIVYLPAKDDVLLYKKFLNKDNLFDRITALYAIENGAEYVVTTMEALMQPFPRHLPSAKYFVAREYPLDGVVKTLVDLGYKRKEFADEKGDFALRGDILEVFPINEERAVRCEFFGDEIERIRFIDENRQSGEEVRSFLCLPTVDFFIDRAEIENLISTLDRSRKKFKTLLPRGRADAVFNEITDTLERGALTDVNLSFLYPLLSGVTNDISEIFPKCKAIIFDEPKLVADGAERVFAEHTSRYESLLAGGEVFDFSFDNLKTPSFVAGKFKVACHSIQNINSVNKLVNPLDTIRLRVSPVSKYQRDLEQLPVDVKNWKAAGYSVIIACGNEKRRDDIAAFLDKWGVEALGVTSNGITKGKCYVVSDYYSEGFILHDDKSVVVGSLDLYVSGIKEKRIKKRRNDNFSAPEVGDFAVHETYGIGLVRGVERITTTDGSKDYVALEYYGGDYMYVPTEQMDKLTKYLGGEKSPMLSRLGGGEFEKIKERVRRSISEMKINLKKLYGERASKKGFAFSADNEMTEQFEGAFGYDLTEDQAQSVYEIKRDMESDKIMDRLLLGDVGFGKTEVALRACFKAVMDGKQVAFVAPTTILTEQHYQTIKERFKDFAVTSCVLNRFQSPKKIRENLKMIEAGEIDIVVGTHRIFGKDVKFHDLGLLVLDEEQRFGVEHKEKLRLIQNSVDTLTMSATPIPRTLHMSLSGIRDISLINTPPSKRIPVQAYVTEESETLIRDAVLKELSRGGQVFILYNHVETIYEFADKFKKLVPEATAVVGHGQMDKDQLENQIMSFFSGKFDVLIATTIIENGIDVPNANTLIVIDADTLGLFTLYQLKGRVGRGDRLAHAYFTYKPDKVLSDGAYKRLEALMEHTELGSGYKIAMRDLEIRGAGNVLGREQHGHMDRIGYELYAKLLKEQLGEVTKDYETEMDVKLDAYIPEAYISNPSSRLDAYKAIAEIKTAEDEQRVVCSMTELYGEPSEQVKNLILIAKMKNLAKKLEIIKLVVKKSGATLTVKDINSFKDGRLTEAVNKFSGKAVLSFDVNPVINVQASSAASGAEICLELLEFAASLPTE